MSAASLTRADGEAGFTLVEVLVSMLIFSIISVGALVALTGTLDAREKAGDRIADVEALAAARRLMAEDFETLVRRRNRDGLGGFVNASRAVADPDQFELTRRGRANPDGAFARGDLLRVSWRVEDGQLIRSFLPHENPAYVEAPLDRVVLDGVVSMRVDPLLSGTRVQTARLLRPEDAEAVSVTLTHADGTTTRHVFTVPKDGVSGA